MANKYQHLALSTGIGLAATGIGYLHEEAQKAFDIFKEEIIESIIKPTKKTAVHHYLYYFQDIEDELCDAKVGDTEGGYYFVLEVLEELNMHPDLPKPDFESCEEDCAHDECMCKDIAQKWFDYVVKNRDKIDGLIIHSAFQILFQDKRFLHDFHVELAKFVESHIEEIREMYPDYVTSKGRIARKYFPGWMKKAVQYRDKGTCTLCKCDLSNLERPQNIVHIDHIVPLDLFGSNDASNFQLLCESCNTGKGARSTTVGPVDVPFWSIEL